MANIPRYAIIAHNSVFHVTWQCHNKDWILQTDWAKQLYYDLLLKYKDKYGIQIYSYAFMSNHPHITGKCQDKKLFSDFFRVVNSMFAKSYNKIVGRRGQVVMDRFKSPRIETDVDLLKVMQYIDLNPKRASMVKHPKDFKWSSYRFYAYGEADDLLTPAPSYLALATTSQERQAIYCGMITEILKNDWHEKRNYSSIRFIGNPDWVLNQTKQLKLTLTAKRLQFFKYDLNATS